MYVCICQSVTDSDIRAAVDSGVRNLRQLKAETGCGTGCGTCAQVVRRELADALVEKKTFLRIIPAHIAA
jgi:bacterioferritin-associated ferredoxin